MNLQDFLDPVIDASYKGFPHASAALRCSAIGAQGWNVLRGDLPLPLAVIREEPLAGNLRWMQRFASERGMSLAPHGKTTMSPQLFRRQLDEGAWGMTFATLVQLRVGVAAGARRCIIANQVFRAADLDALEALRAATPGLQVMFLLDSLQQLRQVEEWNAHRRPAQPLDVLLELGVPGGRTGLRDADAALDIARRVHAGSALRLHGLACYEGLGATGDTAKDLPYVAELLGRLEALARDCDRESLWGGDEVILSAGGSALFDLVADRLRASVRLPMRAVLRSGCYVTHDHGFYRRMVSAVTTRLGCGEGLHAALEVWAVVQSCPEPGLAILGVGKRDISYDLDLPVPLASSRAGGVPQPAHGSWKVTGLNDQHAYLRGDAGAMPEVGDIVGLGISHPCTTFDKWRWMPVVDEGYTVRDAIATFF
jgi:D-serine dehydratase